MDCEEVMLTVRIAAAERALLRELARGHGADMSDVAADGLIDVVPSLHVLPAFPVRPEAAVLPVGSAAGAGTGFGAASGAGSGVGSASGAVDAGVLRLLRVLARPAPCALTLWLPAPVADLLPLVGERITAVTGLRIGPASAALSAALRYWLAGDPQQLAAGLAALHRQGSPGLAAQRLDVAA
ncbi:hypothetical protein [Kitasatospora purpeofusca]|uniref:hypothetical protein n=1 Tax=Kitasatospora purpeofusca TaxID=67352 RepID=UPI0022577D45|nr:hypothetical protein [Kitasatospora purpeofusca]MCX4755907.1 hypothetical protein [Kitasatospora purpeofusca]WSR36242.1 hypothetical protein OG715_38015 [Kitasatospora purpeofusca]WSR44531.1 hypothetical protein OG196_38895 [Kitasatospora purpeofusca]